MSRTIKFRVWSAEDKEYRTDCRLTELFTSETGTLATMYSDEGDQFDIEQYTGLKDKNGKEIYEGDIIALDLGPGGFQPKYFNNDKSKVPCDITKNQHGPVFYDERTASFYYKLCDTRGLTCKFKPATASNRMIVIGNIHENPELLEGEK